MFKLGNMCSLHFPHPIQYPYAGLSLSFNLSFTNTQRMSRTFPFISIGVYVCVCVGVGARAHARTVHGYVCEADFLKVTLHMKLNEWDVNLQKGIHGFGEIRVQLAVST